MIIRTKSRQSSPSRRRAQTAIEYLIVLGVTTSIALVGFRYFVPKARDKGEGFYNQAVINLFGPPPNMSANPVATATIYNNL